MAGAGRHIPRLYLSPPPQMPQTPPLLAGTAWAGGQVLPLAGSTREHVRTVLRLGAGDAVRVWDGVHGEWAARLTGRAAGVALEAAVAPQPAAVEVSPGVSVPAGPWLLASALKPSGGGGGGGRSQWAVEKATELGVGVVWPVYTARVQGARPPPALAPTLSAFLAGAAAASGADGERAKAVAHAIGAAEQCGRLSLPLILPLTNLADALRLLATAPAPAAVAATAAAAGAAAAGASLSSSPEAAFHVLVADEAAPGHDSIAAVRLAAGAIPALLIGPEGGWAPEDRAVMMGAATGTGTASGGRNLRLSTVSLGRTTLRAETAAIAGLAVLSARHLG